MSNEQCQGKTKFLGYCDRKPNVVRDGSPYCWQHDPVKTQADAKAAWEQRKAEIARIETEQDARIERRRLLEASGVDKLTNDDLRTIIANGGIRKMMEA